MPPEFSAHFLSRLLDEITALAAQAAAAVVALGPTLIRRKPDGSPVTAADERAQQIILDGVAGLLPGVPIVSEEAAKPASLPGATFVLVDPLDGTREFIAGSSEYTVNIALIENGTPVLGCVAAPALGLLWRGAVGQGAQRLATRDGAATAPTSITTRIRATPPDVLVSRSHFDRRTEQLVQRLGPARTQACGSSLKFCRLAEGAADFYPRLAPTSEWDLAAGHAILASAGGAMVQPDGGPLIYGQHAPRFIVPEFLAAGDLAALDRLVVLARS